MKASARGRRVGRTLAFASLALPLLASAAPRCESVEGRVALAPAPGACTGLGVTVIPDQNGAEQCFTVSIRGGLQGTGVAGVYSEGVLSLPLGVQSVTPLLVFAGQTPPRQVLTAKSRLTLDKGTLEGQEIILITPAGDVVEQALLLNGTGRYANAFGSLAIVGNSIGRSVPYTGRICYP
jgi:hypothetical protein